LVALSVCPPKRATETPTNTGYVKQDRQRRYRYRRKTLRPAVTPLGYRGRGAIVTNTQKRLVAVMMIATLVVPLVVLLPFIPIGTMGLMW